MAKRYVLRRLTNQWNLVLPFGSLVEYEFRSEVATLKPETFCIKKITRYNK